MQGQTIAHYEILSRLGKGGMGEVYLARDSKLKRQVALKILPPELASSPTRLKRFQREAETLAALNHPNIVAIHSVEESAGVHFLTMELVKGETLSRVIPKAGMDLERFFDLAIPLVDALTAAHDSRVVHRDLKPSNIMITNEGYLRVLDFGLAKPLRQPEAGASDVSTAVLLESTDPESGELSLTEEGRVLGTAPYMSPEQANGLEVDHRTDLFSAGAIFHQMLTGEPPFTGATKSEIMASVLRDDPPSVDSEREELPRHLGRIVRKCLEKKPNLRYQASRDLGNDLEGLRGEIASGELDAVPARGPSQALVGLIASAAVLTLAIVLLWLIARSPWTDSAPAGELTLSALSEGSNTASSSRLSPDGEWVMLLTGEPDARELSLRRVRGGEPIPATPRSGNVISFIWSPDGNRVAHIVRRDDGIFLTVQPAFGGPIEQTLPLEVSLAGANLIRWIGNRLYLADSRQGVLRMDLESGRREDIAPTNSVNGRRHDFDVSQDGNSLVFGLRRDGRLTLWKSDLDGENAIQVSPEGFSACCARWVGMSDTHIVYESNRSGQPDLWLGTVSDGSMQQITFSSDVETVGDVSLNGRALTFGSRRNGAELWALEPATGSLKQVTTGLARARWPTTAGTRVVYQSSRPALESLDTILGGQLRIRDTPPGVTGLDSILVDDGAFPRLSPDGRRVVYVRRNGPHLSLRVREIDTGRDEELEQSFYIPGMYGVPSDPMRNNLAWSADSQEIFLLAKSPEGGQDLRRVWLDGERLPETLASAGTNAEIGDLQLAKSGDRLIYVTTNYGGQKVAELHVLDLREGSDRVLYRDGDLDEGDELFAKGWLGGEQAFVVIRATANPDWTEDLQVLAVGLDGSIEALGQITRAFGGAAQLEPTSRQLYVTQAAASGVHNLTVLSLGESGQAQLTNNQRLDVSFSGISVVAPGRVLFSQTQRSTSVWLVRFEKRVG